MITRRQSIAPLAALLVAWAGLISCGKTAKKSTAMEQSPAQYKVKLQTTKGDVVILVHRDWSPLAADHFYELVKMGYYDNNYFFRVLKGFVVQFGMNGDPAVNKSWSQITIKDDPPKVSNKTGSVTFAKPAEANARTTQVFINIADNSKMLDEQGFTPFGEVIQGLDIVMTFYSAYGDAPPQGQGPNQAAIADIGNAYLEEHFPHLDYIKKATILP
jgi:peptidyl-prolyl cis-trans isomerase A (cyclophilin A)